MKERLALFMRVINRTSSQPSRAHTTYCEGRGSQLPLLSGSSLSGIRSLGLQVSVFFFRFPPPFLSFLPLPPPTPILLFPNSGFGERIFLHSQPCIQPVNFLPHSPGTITFCHWNPIPKLVLQFG